MFGHRSPMRQINCVGGNGMAQLGKGIFYILGFMFLLGAVGGSGGFLLLIVALIILCSIKGKK